jgi:hypothetical protein
VHSVVGHAEHAVDSLILRHAHSRPRSKQLLSIRHYFYTRVKVFRSRLPDGQKARLRLAIPLPAIAPTATSLAGQRVGRVEA